MIKIWRVFVYEYLRHVLRKRFIMAVLSLPLVVVLAGAAGMLAVVTQMDSRPVGYIDLAGVIQNVPDDLEPGMFSGSPILEYTSEEAAQADLNAGTIQAFYVIQPDYFESGQVRMVALENPSGSASDFLEKVLRYNLLEHAPAGYADRVWEGTQLDVRSTDNARQMNMQQWYLILFPIFSGVAFMIVINTSGGYLLQAVVEEKENRTIEIVVTSMSPTQLMAGKILGNLSVGLTQLLIWLGFPLLAFTVAKAFFPPLQDVTLDPQYIWILLVTLLPSFVLVAALMAGIGATATETREAQQVAGMFTLPIAIPYWFMNLIMTNPNSPISVALSLFPLTAPVTLQIRSVFTVVPTWQVILSVGLLVVSAIGAVWLAGRVFRLGMLRYGKRLSFKELFTRA